MAKRKAIEVREGSALVKIYPGSHRSFVVCWYSLGRRRRVSRSGLERATQLAKRLARMLSRGEQCAAAITSAEASEYRAAMAALAPLGMPLGHAVAEFVHAQRVLAGRPLSVAVDAWASRSAAIAEIAIPDAIEQFLESKASEGIGKKHLADLRSGLGRFGRSFKGQLAGMAGPEIEAWLHALRGRAGTASAYTRKNYLAQISNFANWAKRRGYLPNDWAELGRVGKSIIRAGQIAIWTASEFAKILSEAEPAILPILCFGGFAGLRTAEIKALQWENVGEWIHIPSASKTGRRLVPVLPNLKAWLAQIGQRSGPVCRLANPHVRLRRAARRAGFAWRPNALRHSFVSYRLATNQDLAQTSLECGNGPKVLLKHYRELVTPAQAKEWFGITPDVGRIIQLNFGGV